ncbi:hypothetical protein PHYBOEH_011877 [Phytophthora boehmeriae]|uniref:Uncharacterized protein n=1 Tax=Phytophthora boehmeriae TaxID=109152 RepID=A0A8T1VHC4_9STRA|nr:hypothetical protein PHYBOEH_011877 [Phytophthora boehmeriae]
MPGTSVNARKQQEEDVERLVKCRLRSEIEARKAAESTMKRAVQEARDLKRELVLLRQEKEELRVAALKHAVSPPPDTSTGGKETSRRNSNKATELNLKRQIQLLIARNSELETVIQELQQQASELESQKTAALAQSTADVAERGQEIAALEVELHKAKLAAGETKRKCQKLVKEKKEETQRVLQEYEQLEQCTKALQSQLALLPQLKIRLEQAKVKHADVVEEWRKKLEQRDQAFLREEEASKRKLAGEAAQIQRLSEEKYGLLERLEELEAKLRGVNSTYDAELRHKELYFDELEVVTKQLRDELLAAHIATEEAVRAEVVARETQAQETRLRQLAENAADVVEARAKNAERDLAQARTQLSRIEDALRVRGVTLDYLLKQQTPVSITARSSGIGKDVHTTGTTGTRKASTTRDPARSSIMSKARYSSGAEHKGRARLKNNNDEEL